MKTKIRNRVVSLLIAALMLWGFASQAAALSETESNNSIVEANRISVNSTVYGTTIKYNDDDWYIFTISSNGYIQIDFNHDYGSGIHYVKLFSYDGTTQTRLLYFTVEKTSHMNQSPKYGIPAGTYYVMIDPDSNMNSSEYSFTVNYNSADNWETEMNNNITEADSISVNETFYGSTINKSYDEDWYTFTTYSDGNIQIELNHDYGKHNHYVYLYTYNGTSKTKVFYFTIEKTSQKNQSQKYSLPAGTYYVLIKQESVTDSSEYNFRVAFSEETATTRPEKTTQAQRVTTSAPTAKPNSTNASTRKPNVTTRVNSSYAETSYRFVESSNSDYSNTQNSSDNSSYSNDIDIFINGDFSCYILEGTVIINKYLGSDEYVVIPNEVNGYSVYGIDDLAFSNTAAETVVVPSDVGQIGYNAFYNDDGSSIKIICEPDSFAEQFAQQNGLDYELTNDLEEVVIEDENFEPDEPQTAKASTHGGVSLTSLAIVGVVSGVIIMALIAIIIAKNNIKNPKAKN